MAARGGHPGMNGDVATRPVPNTLQDSFLTLLALVYVAGMVAVVVLLFYRRPGKDPREGRWRRSFLTILVMALATALLTFAVKHRYIGGSGHVGAAQGRPPAAGRDGQGGPVTGHRDAKFQWPLAIGVAGLVLIGGVWLYVRRRAELPPLDPEGGLEDELVSALEDTIDDLRHERDPRRAVIAAYAQMERALTAHGVPRNRAETQLEYLGRVLRALAVRDSAARALTELFEYAKFSPHEIDSAMKDRAIGALSSVRDDLRREEVLAA